MVCPMDSAPTSLMAQLASSHTLPEQSMECLAFSQCRYEGSFLFLPILQPGPVPQSLRSECRHPGSKVATDFIGLWSFACLSADIGFDIFLADAE